jgi:hypothetical protein
MLVWFALVTLFFSAASSKLVGYILPVAPPLAMLLADAARGLPTGWRTGCAIGAAVICPLLAISAHYWQPKSLEALGLYLKANRQPGEPLIDLGAYDYDVPFYAQLDAPMTVVDPWLATEIAKDSWRRELTDARALRKRAGTVGCFDRRNCTASCARTPAAGSSRLGHRASMRRGWQP